MIAHAGIDHAAIGVAAATVVGVYGLAWRHHPSTRRLWCWIAGVALVVVASSPWMERLAEETFAGHMVQHLVVIIGAAPLLVLARPVHTMVRAGWIPLTRTGRIVGAAWHRWAALVGPALFVVVLFATHLTSVYDRALDDRLLHEVEHAAYLAAACAMWSAALGVGRSTAVARVGGVFGVIAGGAFLGIILLAAAEPLMPTYEARLGTQDALDDQRTAAAIMWVTGMLTTAAAAVRRRLAVGLGRGADRSSGRGPRRRDGHPAAAARRSTVASEPPVTATAVTGVPSASRMCHVPSTSSGNSAAVT